MNKESIHNARGVENRGLESDTRSLRRRASQPHLPVFASIIEGAWTSADHFHCTTILERWSSLQGSAAPGISPDPAVTSPTQRYILPLHGPDNLTVHVFICMQKPANVDYDIPDQIIMALVYYSVFTGWDA